MEVSNTSDELSEIGGVRLSLIKYNEKHNVQ